MTTGAWATDGPNHYEWRWRTQAMGASSGTWGSWSAWTAWVPVAVTIDGMMVWATDGLPAEVSSTIRAIQYELQVRAVTTDGSGGVVVGSASCATLRAVQVVHVTLGSAGFGPEGLRLAYETDYDGGTVTVSVESVSVEGAELLSIPATFAGLDPEGSVLLPVSLLASWVADGDEAIVSYRCANDMLPLSGTADSAVVNVSYNAGSGLVATPTVMAGQGRTVSVEVPTAEVSSAWLRHAGSLSEMPVSDGVASIAYPFGGDADYEVFVAVHSLDGTRWGVAHITTEGMAEAISAADSCHAWNWPGGSFLLEMREGDPLETDYSVESDAQPYKLNAREWDTYLFGDTKSGRFVAVGAMGASLGVEATRDALDALLNARHVTYRSPHGDVADVAVLSAHMTCSRGIWNVSVEMSRETV